MSGEPERKEASAFTKFRLLMWKNFLMQWRHPAQTIAELIVPVAAMSLILVLRSEIQPELREQMNYGAIVADTMYPSNSTLLLLRRMNATQLSLAYSPANPMLESVVRDAVSKLLLNNIIALLPIMTELFPILAVIDVLPINSTVIQEIIGGLIRVDGYNSSADLSPLYSTEERTREIFAAIEFPDSFYNETSLPINISYEIRFPEMPRMNSFFAQGSRSWRTTGVFPALTTPGPRDPNSPAGGLNPGYVTELFIALQHSISMELISRLTGEDMDIDVSVQRYPHPPYLYDLATTMLIVLFPMFIVLSFSYTVINIVRAVTLEKELQLKEAMKIMGLPTWLHWTAWFFKQFMFLCISTALLVLLVKVRWFSTEDGLTSYGVFDRTPWTVLAFFLLLYFASTIFLGFMISGFFSKASTAALFTVVLWFILYSPAVLMSMDEDISMAAQIISCLSINCAMSYGFQIMLNAENIGGLQWGNFFTSPSSDGSRLLFGQVALMLALDCVLYMLVALYLEQVFPGPFGTPKPWNFLFKKDFWFTDSSKVTGELSNGLIHDDLSMQEEDPKDLTIGVKISNLSKIFGNNTAVNDLSLNIYNDQITVLLGHNGAGKSTTIAILTGNVKASSGSVVLAGYDVQRQGAYARANLGFCPQHNVLFNELTVKEHLEFFARLKGRTGKELQVETDTLIEKLELQEKRNSQSQGLSGGQKRRLCVGIALCGGAKVVLLDEPTSGMDPASRRALWTLLQKEKKDRSMILTTHFMDEADYLGDRVAIMLTGRLQCVGSPYFLKRKYGVGYTLTVVKRDNFDPEKCTNLISKYIPESNIKEERGTEVSYTLLNEYSYAFEDMLKDLESQAELIGYANYGLTATTLEDVFMAAGSDVQHDTDDTTDSVGSSGPKYDGDTSSIDFLEGREKLVTGLELLWQHTYAIWFKLFLVWTRSWGLLALQIFVPLLVVNITLGVFTYMISLVDNVMSRPLTLQQGYTYTETYLTYVGNVATSIGASASQAYQTLFNTDNMVVLPLGNQDLQEYYLDLASNTDEIGRLRTQVPIGATFTDDAATAWFSNFGYHDVAISVAAVHNALLKSRLPEAEINVFNHPLEAQYNNAEDMQLIVTMLSMQLTNGIGTCLSIVNAVFIMFYIKERVSRAKLLQKASGIEPAVLWGSAAVFDWLWFLIIGVTIVISCLAFSVIGMSSFDELGRFYVVLMVYGAAALPLMYLMSHCFSGPAYGFAVVTFVNILLGLIGPQIVEAIDTEPVPEVLDSILQFFPLYSAVTSMRKLHETSLMEWSCMRGCSLLAAAALPAAPACSMEAMCTSYSSACCMRENPHFEWADPGVLRYLCCMLLSGGVLWALLMAAEYRLIDKIISRKASPPPLDLAAMDEDVVDEIRHVEAIGAAGSKQHNLVAMGLTKYYAKNLAVNQVSFTVGEMECFGLLGVNGAGKTTTFKMLMGDEAVSRGDARVRGHSVKTSIKRVHENIGYCPQFDAVFEELSGRETLRLFALLRGLRPGATAALTAHLADTLGFTKHLDKRVHQYSGGNKRKLSTAIALLGFARVIFLDEPTTGVDPAAKRQVWAAVRKATNAGRSVVLTSHSMEECEALCSRLTIMVNGQFKCLGTPQHLKNKFSEGITLNIKLKSEEGTVEEATSAVKAYVEDNFTNPKLMEEYYGVLTYYLPPSGAGGGAPWSGVFGALERARRALPVEAYSVAQTTLEQIFLQFTKYQLEGDKL